MRLALMQASRNLGNTKTNPSVGCVVVKNNNVIGSASTSFNGRPHAEQNAIFLSNNKIFNADLYVTLEPCSHYGKTPPCVLNIAKKKVRKVYFSIYDPDTRSFKKSIKFFRKKNIRTSKGILSNEVKDFYKSYIKYKKNKLPFVTSKIAVSKDFFSKHKKDRWLTNKYSRGRVHYMRSVHDCILTSYKTVLEDNPRLDCRIKGLENRSPHKIILDKDLKTPIKSNILKSRKKYQTLIFYNRVKEKKINTLKKMNIKLIKMPLNKKGSFNLKNILMEIKKKKFTRIFLEAGINLTKSFFQEGLIDEFHLFISKNEIGKNGNLNFKKLGNKFLKKENAYFQKVNLLGDKLITYKFN